MKSHANDSTQTRVAVLETTIAHINETLQRIENRLEKIDAKIDNRFMWTMGTLLAFIGTPIFVSVLKTIHLIQQ